MTIYITGYKEPYEQDYLVVYHSTREGAEKRLARLQDDVRQGYGYGIPFIHAVELVK